MKSKVFLMGILSVMLVFGLTLTSCSDDDDDGDNPFAGSWTGTAIMDGQSASATITVTNSGWNFKVPSISMNESGTYTRDNNSATLKSGSSTIGTANVSGSTLTVTLTAGDYRGGTGTFHK
jgi:hypothetical protein